MELPSLALQDELASRIEPQDQKRRAVEPALEEPNKEGLPRVATGDVFPLVPEPSERENRGTVAYVVFLCVSVNSRDGLRSISAKPSKDIETLIHIGTIIVKPIRLGRKTKIQTKFAFQEPPPRRISSRRLAGIPSGATGIVPAACSRIPNGTVILSPPTRSWRMPLSVHRPSIQTRSSTPKRPSGGLRILGPIGGSR